MSRRIAVYGASGHGKVVADIAKKCGYDEIIYIDDGDNEYLNFNDFSIKYICPVALGIGDNRIRAMLFGKLKSKGYETPVLIHPSAVVAESAEILQGTVVMAGSVINPSAFIGQGVIINTGAIVEHDNIIGDFSHIAPNVALAGNVKIGDHTQIGIGSCVRQNITVGAGCMVGAGSVIVKNIPDRVVAFGNPCAVVKDC